MAGRKSKYTPEVVSDICKAIREGMSQEDAARLAGISVSQFYEWLKQPAKAELTDGIKRAHADFKEANVRAIRAAGVRAIRLDDGTFATTGQWQANAWLLERKYRDEFGRVDKIIHEFSPETLEILRQLEQLAKAKGTDAKEIMRAAINALDEQKVNAE